MASDKQIEANRRNAKKSTGPTSKRGSSISSKNAMKHGIFTDDLIVRLKDFGESEEEFRRLLDGLIEQFKPRKEFEKVLVDLIAKKLWQLKRVHRYLTDAALAPGKFNLEAAKEAARSRFRDVEQFIGGGDWPVSFRASPEIMGEVLRCLDEMIVEAEKDGLLPPDAGDKLWAIFGRSFKDFAIQTKTMDEIFRARREKNEEARIARETNPESEPDEQSGEPTLIPDPSDHPMLTGVPNALKDKRDEIKKLVAVYERVVAEEIQKEEERCLNSSGISTCELPPSILKREAELEKGIYRAVHELQRQQASGLGRSAGVPAAVDVEVHGINLET